MSANDWSIFGMTPANPDVYRWRARLYIRQLPQDLATLIAEYASTLMCEFHAFDGMSYSPSTSASIMFDDIGPPMKLCSNLIDIDPNLKNIKIVASTRGQITFDLLSNMMWAGRNNDSSLSSHFGWKNGLLEYGFPKDAYIIIRDRWDSLDFIRSSEKGGETTVLRIHSLPVYRGILGFREDIF